MSGQPNLLEARDLHKSFGRGPGRVHVLRGLDLSVRRGEFLAVMGPSGCGKSTLLHVLGLMTPPDRGAVVLDGQTVPARPAERAARRRTHLGFIFQRFNLLGVLSAADNVRISLQVRGKAYDGRVDELFETVGVSHVAGRKPGRMSIGEQQRVAVVRALAHRPALLLADEPTGNLDADNGRRLLDVLGTFHKAGQTIVMVTHDDDVAARADRRLVLADGRLAGAGG